MTDGYGFASQPAIPWKYNCTLIANPAPAAEINFMIPNNALWEITEIGFRLITSAVAGNRLVLITTSSNTANAGLQEVSNACAEQVQVPSFSALYRFTRNPHNFYAAAIPAVFASIDAKLIMTPGDTFKTVTTGLAAGDQYSNIYISYREYQSFTPLAFT